jgi:flagellar biosynthesis protein FliQ
MPKEERSSIIDQVMGNQPANSLSTEAITGIIVVVLWCLYAMACCGIVISCIRATHLTTEETLPPLPIFQAMKIGLFLI